MFLNEPAGHGTGGVIYPRVGQKLPLGHGYFVKSSIPLSLQFEPIGHFMQLVTS